MRSKLKMFRSGDGTGFLYMTEPGTYNPGSQTVFLPGGDNPGDGTQLNLGNPKTGDLKPPAAGNAGNDTTATDPRVEGDYYSMDCKQLASIIAYIQNLLASARFSSGVSSYYTDKLNQAQTAYDARCGGNPPAVDPASPPPSQVDPKKPDTTINIGDVSALNPSGATGSGGGGGDSATKAATAKKTNWLLWALAIGAFGLALYKGRNTVVKMPG